MSAVQTAAHVDLYRSSTFRFRAAAALACQPRDLVDATDDLLDAGLIPTGPGMPAGIAVWADAARILAALAAQRAYPASVTNLVQRICAMRPHSPQLAVGAAAPSRSFGADVATLLRRPTDNGAPAMPSVSVTCSHATGVLLGQIDYADRGGPTLNYCDFSQTTAEEVGSYPQRSTMSFAGSAIAKLADILSESIVEPHVKPENG